MESFFNKTLVNTWIFNSKLFPLIIVLFDTHVHCIQNWTKEESHMLYLLLQVNIIIEQCTASSPSSPAIISILVLQAQSL